MEDFLSFDTSFGGNSKETQLIINVNKSAEQDFLAKIGGAGVRKKDVAAMVDQYYATHVGTLCFDGSDKQALSIWAERCRELGLTCLLHVEAASDFSFVADTLCTDGIVLDCRSVSDYSVIAEATKAAGDGKLYLLVSVSPEVLKEQNADLQAVNAVIVCPNGRSTDSELNTKEWLSEEKDYDVYAGFSSDLCETNGKVWYATPEIMNGFASYYLAQGCSGLWLDGFCTDLFEPDSTLYDIYETCGKLEECVGAKRRHLVAAQYPRMILPGADYHYAVDVSPVFEGAPVCIVLAMAGAESQHSVTVTVDGRKLEFTGAPAIIARNERGRFCENQCIPVHAKTFEFFVGNAADDEPISVCIHNNSKREIALFWNELTVNV